MTGRSMRESLMLKVLLDVARAGLKPLLWHLDQDGLKAFRDAARRHTGSASTFMDVPINPVAKRGGHWMLDVASGITIRGRWPEPPGAAPIVRGRRKPTPTLH